MSHCIFHSFWILFSGCVLAFRALGGHQYFMNEHVALALSSPNTAQHLHNIMHINYVGFRANNTWYYHSLEECVSVRQGRCLVTVRKDAPRSHNGTALVHS